LKSKCVLLINNSSIKWMLMFTDNHTIYLGRSHSYKKKVKRRIKIFLIYIYIYIYILVQDNVDQPSIYSRVLKVPSSQGSSKRIHKIFKFSRIFQKDLLKFQVSKQFLFKRFIKVSYHEGSPERITTLSLSLQGSLLKRFMGSPRLWGSF
jgi:hypothetical protein